MKYSASKNAFYHPDIHGENIPGDAIDITDKQHAALLEKQSHGKEIAAGQNGKPIAVEPKGLSGSALIINQIKELEYQQTPRRIREHVLGIDDGWLADLNAKIEVLRGKL